MFGSGGLLPSGPSLMDLSGRLWLALLGALGAAALQDASSFLHSRIMDMLQQTGLVPPSPVPLPAITSQSGQLPALAPRSVPSLGPGGPLVWWPLRSGPPVQFWLCLFGLPCPPWRLVEPLPCGCRYRLLSPMRGGTRLCGTLTGPRFSLLRLLLRWYPLGMPMFSPMETCWNSAFHVSMPPSSWLPVPRR